MKNFTYIIELLSKFLIKQSFIDYVYLKYHFEVDFVHFVIYIIIENVFYIKM